MTIFTPWLILYRSCAFKMTYLILIVLATVSETSIFSRVKPCFVLFIFSSKTFVSCQGSSVITNTSSMPLTNSSFYTCSKLQSKRLRDIDSSSDEESNDTDVSRNVKCRNVTSPSFMDGNSSASHAVKSSFNLNESFDIGKSTGIFFIFLLFI